MKADPGRVRELPIAVFKEKAADISAALFTTEIAQLSLTTPRLRPYPRLRNEEDQTELAMHDESERASGSSRL